MTPSSTCNGAPRLILLVPAETPIAAKAMRKVNSGELDKDGVAELLRPLFDASP